MKSNSTYKRLLAKIICKICPTCFNHLVRRKKIYIFHTFWLNCLEIKTYAKIISNPKNKIIIIKIIFSNLLCLRQLCLDCSQCSTMLSLLKGLPSTYNKDLQLDKVCMFSAHDDLQLALQLCVATIHSLQVCCHL